MTDQTMDPVGTPVHPPLLLAGLMGTAVLQRVFNVPSPLGKKARWAGIPVILLGLFLGGWAVRAQRQHGTTPNPHEPTTALVENGPYRYTRNPIYLGMGLISAGFAILLNAVWTLPLVPAFYLSLDRSMVQQEESYLERKFGKEYRAYKNRVPRWI